MAQTNTRSIKESAKKSASIVDEKEREARLEQVRKNAGKAKAAVFASKANMVKKFNEND